MTKEKHGLTGKPSNSSKGRQKWVKKTIRIDPDLIDKVEQLDQSLTDLVDAALKKHLK